MLAVLQLSKELLWQLYEATEENEIENRLYKKETRRQTKIATVIYYYYSKKRQRAKRAIVKLSSNLSYLPQA